MLIVVMLLSVLLLTLILPTGLSVVMKFVIEVLM